MSDNFQGTYKVTAKPLGTVRSGAWYFGFDCLVCSKRFAVFDDPSNGASPTKFAGGGHFRVACPHCGSDRLYGVDAVRHFRAESPT